MKIYFDSTLLDNDYIVGLNQKAELFDSTFKLGSTVCRNVELDVYKTAVTTQPTNVYIKDDSDNTLITLQVDSVDTNNDSYYSYTLVDKMVNLNTKCDWSGLESKTVQNIVKYFCTELLNMNESDVPTIEYGGDLEVTWDTDTTARSFISYVAELNGCYAIINDIGNLEFKKYTNTTTHTVNVDDCADIKIGEKHLIDRVVYEYGVATVKVPKDEEYTGTGNTLYLNENNILFTDSGSYTIQAEVEHIYNLVNGLEFYSLTTSQCPIDESVRVGDIINFIYGDNTYPTIAQIDWDYNNMWLGGYSLDVATKKQEETTVISSTDNEKLNQVSIKVDRANAAITQMVSDVEGHKGSFALYLNKDDPDDVISCINASADNIILNTKSLIFGEYPDGQYIEEKNWSNDLLEYIETDGSQYTQAAINMYPILSGDILTFEFMPLSYNGALYGDSSTYIKMENGRLEVQLFNDTSCTFDCEINEKHTLIIDFSDGTIKLDDIISINPGYTFVSGSTAPGLFALYDTSTKTYSEQGSYRLYKLARTSNDNQSRRIVYLPRLMKRSNGTISTCLYSLGWGSSWNMWIANCKYNLQNVGVIFDGTGEVDIQPEGRFLVENVDSDNNVWNRMSLSKSEEDTDKFYVENYDDSGATLNKIMTVGNGRYSTNYTYTNSINLQNYCCDSPSLVSNYLSLISTGADSQNPDRNMIYLYNLMYNDGANNANSLSLQALPTTNSLNINNWAFGHAESSQYTANYITLSSSETQNKLGLYNIKLDNTAYKNANYLWMSTTSSNGVIALANYNYNQTYYANYLSMETSSGSDGNRLRLENYSLSSNVLSNYIWFVTTSDSKYIDIRNTNGDSAGNYQNQITLSYSANVGNSHIGMYNRYPNTTTNANLFYLNSSLGVLLENQYSSFSMDMSGNVALKGNNSLNIESNHYNVTIRAGSYNGTNYSVYLYGSHLYWNGVQKW